MRAKLGAPFSFRVCPQCRGRKRKAYSPTSGNWECGECGHYYHWTTTRQGMLRLRLPIRAKPTPTARFCTRCWTTDPRDFYPAHRGKCRACHQQEVRANRALKGAIYNEARRKARRQAAQRGEGG